MKRYAQPLFVFVILGLSLCEGLGHPRCLIEATQEIASEIYSGKDVATKAIVEKTLSPAIPETPEKIRLKARLF